MRAPRSVIVLAAVLVGLSGRAPEAGDGVSRQPPPEFDRHLLARLSDVPPPPTATETAGDVPGVVLLDEEVVWAEADGSYVAAVHRVLAPVTPSGAERARRIVHAVHSRGQRVHVARAVRLAPDGTTDPIGPRAVFLETPELLAAAEVYADVEQVVILAPSVRPGDRVDYVLVREVDPVLPGELTAFLPIADPWPVRRARREVVVPEQTAERLRWEALGVADAAPVVAPAGDGRRSFTWRAAALPAQRLERSREPIRQSGPGIWLSTLSDWSRVGRWYEDLAAPAEVLDPPLAAQVRQWARVAESPEGLVAELVRRVDGRVEYVSLAFGMGALQARPAAEVWASGWGDCKDQAHLLRAMLREAGVESWPVLVNREHRGALVEGVPDFRQFNHVLLAVQLPDGERLYCDPSSGADGTADLPPTVADRTALLVRGTDSGLVRIPAVAPGRLELEFDLELTADGELWGWLDLRAEGFQARRTVADVLAGAGRAEDRLAALLEGAFADLRVVEAGPADEGDPPAGLRAFLHALAWPESDGVALHAPAGGRLIPDPGDEERRQTRYWQGRGGTVVRARYRLPGGWSAQASPPDAFHQDHGAVVAAGEWRQADGGWEVTLRHEAVQSVVEPIGFAPVVRTGRDLAAWRSRGVVVAPSSSPEGRPETAGDRFVRLETAAGQLRLARELFEDDGDDSERRAAYVQVMEWFPDQPEVALEAGIEVAIIDQGAGRDAASAADLRRLLERYGDAAGPELRAWGEYLLADALRTTGREDEALRRYQRIARDFQVPAHRRGWAYARAADLRRRGDPLEAVAMLEEGLRLDSPALPQQVALLVDILAGSAPSEMLQDRLVLVSRLHPHRCADVHARLVDEVYEALNAGRLDRAEVIHGLLGRRIDACPELAFLAESIDRLGEQLAGARACRRVADHIRDHFRREPPAWWCDVAPPADLARDRLVGGLQALDRSGDARAFVRGTVELLTRWSVPPDFFAFLLHRCHDHLLTTGDSPDLGARFLAWGEELRGAGVTP